MSVEDYIDLAHEIGYEVGDFLPETPEGVPERPALEALYEQISGLRPNSPETAACRTMLLEMLCAVATMRRMRHRVVQGEEE